MWVSRLTGGLSKIKPDGKLIFMESLMYNLWNTMDIIWKNWIFQKNVCCLRCKKSLIFGHFDFKKFEYAEYLRKEKNNYFEKSTIIWFFMKIHWKIVKIGRFSEGCIWRW